jgi:MFS family permease
MANVIQPFAKLRRGPLGERPFRLLFLGRTTSFVGSAFANVALAFAVLELTGSKADLGYVLAARALPQVVFLLVGGIWADRLPRHRVMVGSNLVSGLSQAAIAALLLLGHAQIWFGVLLTIPFLLALAVPLPLVGVVVAAGLAGIGMEIFGILWDTAMQQEISQEKLSRVYSYDALGSFVLIPLGLAAAGPIAEAIGTRPTILGAATISLAATLAVLLVRDVRTISRREETGASTVTEGAPA